MAPGFLRSPGGNRRCRHRYRLYRLRLLAAARHPGVILLIVLNMARFANGRIVILALLGLVVGQAVVWYTASSMRCFSSAASSRRTC
jgi:hypothetical protein